MGDGKANINWILFKGIGTLGIQWHCKDQLLCHGLSLSLGSIPHVIQMGIDIGRRLTLRSNKTTVIGATFYGE